MWDRVELKTKAKKVLKKDYWKALIISLVLLIIGGQNSSGGNGSYSNIIKWNVDRFNIEYSATLTLVVIVSAILLFRIFLGYILEVGGRKYFIRAAEDDIEMNNLGFGFQSGRYMSIIITMLYRGVLVFLWTLLLIIPGIVKGYAYSMVPYILADNPNIGYYRAIELSNDMTMGHKLDIFILELSFLGWYFLGLLAFGIGTIFVTPYENSTKAELYLVLRDQAINSKMCTCEELNVIKKDTF